MGPARIAADLSWFWTWSEGEMSPPSNFMAMVNAISLGRSPSNPSTEIDEGRLKAATQARSISRALEGIDDADRRVLYAALGPFRRDLPVLGDAAPVAPLTRAARTAHSSSHTTRSFTEWLVRLCWRVSQQKGDRVLEDSATLHSIASEAKAALHGAVTAYVKAERELRELAVQSRHVPFKPDRAAGVEGGEQQAPRATEI